MTITTADCQEFLANRLHMDAHGFKCIQKFNDGDIVVREFSHPVCSDQIFLAEENGQLTLTSSMLPSLQKKLANKYVFTLVPDSYHKDDIVVLMTRRTLWKKEERLDDEEDDQPLNFFPPDWVADQVSTSRWVIVTNMTADEVIATLHDLGCHSDAKFDQLCEGRSALDCPLVVDRKIKDVLNKTFADSPASSKAPNKM